MALNFYNVLEGRVQAEQARNIQADTTSQRIANASSFMDLQSKLRMLPAIKNQENTAIIESDVALKRAKARSSLLPKERIAKQEAIVLEMQDSDLAMKQRAQDMSAIAQWAPPVTPSNKEEFFTHLEQSGVDLGAFGYDKDMDAAEVGVLNQVWKDTYIATQKQLQAKDLAAVEQQYALDRDQHQQNYAMQQNLQKFTFDLALQRERLNAEARIRQMMSAGAPDIPQNVVVWDNEREFGDTFIKAMSARFPNAPWVDDEKVLNNLSGFAYKETTGLGNQAYLDWKAGKADIPQTREAYFDETVNNMIGQIGLDGEYYDDPNAAQLKEDKKKFKNDFLANPSNRQLMNAFIEHQSRMGNSISEDEFIDMAFGRGDFRGYTPADPYKIERGAESNIPIQMRSERAEAEANLPSWLSRRTY